MKIPFNKPYITGNELDYISEAYTNSHLSGDGAFTLKCHEWLEVRTGTRKALLTHSCTAALEMAAILIDIQPGDEVIMPSYTFVSTANAFLLRGAVPVFVDIRSDNLNLDETRIEAAISEKTRAIVVVHYAGVGCEMASIMALANSHGLWVVEDTAQGSMSAYQGKPLGAIGHIGALSFHQTKNISCGEGGALLLNDDRLIERAEIIREKGTNRNAFFRGEIDKYSWVDIGSSYLPSELMAAPLWAQMECADDITSRRLAIWNTYHSRLKSLETRGIVRRPLIPDDCDHNGHMYYLILQSETTRDEFIQCLKDQGILSIFHYVPLHSSVMGKKFGKTVASLEVTEDLSQRLVRLPFWLGLEEHLPYVIEKVIEATEVNCGSREH
ncbi:MAG: dTDP-4-amino-4,6-dideoxygalactose transaminase [Arenicellales bacterium]|nr:dTDP-4-amino-4,6-dideoxygalactose transaminase [Arenicellales bacterium]